MDKIAVRKISKGYRLKQETHNMIKQIQAILKSNSDEAISTACRRLLDAISIGESEDKTNNQHE